jgi:hypothetical protein
VILAIPGARLLNRIIPFDVAMTYRYSAAPAVGQPWRHRETRAH